MRVLIDTSIWSLALRRAEHVRNPESLELRRLITAHLAEIIGPIRQEVLSGVRDQSQFDRLESHLAAFPDLPLLTEDYVTAAKFFNLCRSRGIQGANTDFLICAVAVRHDFTVFTTDGDFPLFAKCLPVVLHEISKTTEQTPARYRRSRAET
ncbi:MAG: PIN domain-containing protein [Lentisphaerae bacterium]|nr:PIN domain-containing protein [Lentisphaerota bacterium]